MYGHCRSLRSEIFFDELGDHEVCGSNLAYSGSILNYLCYKLNFSPHSTTIIFIRNFTARQKHIFKDRIDSINRFSPCRVFHR